MTLIQKEFIAAKRMSILAELKEFLREIGHDMTSDDVLAAVYEDDDEDSFDDLIVVLSNGDIHDPERAQELAMELYNFFPRKSFGGASLAEKMPFDELKKMDQAFQDFKDGTGTDYAYTFNPTK